MSDDTPLGKKRALENRAKICRQEIEKLRHERTEICAPRIRTYRADYGRQDPSEVQLVDHAALRAFLIRNLEEQALRYEREANRARFEVIAWSEAQAELMRAEIAAFNATRLGGK